jgi:hypothetical protein
LAVRSGVCTPAEAHEKGGIEGEAGYFGRNHWVPVPEVEVHDVILLFADGLFGQRAELRGDQSGSDLDDWLQAEEEIRRAQEQSIDEASEESFPASDPPAY